MFCITSQVPPCDVNPWFPMSYLTGRNTLGAQVAQSSCSPSACSQTLIMKWVWAHTLNWATCFIFCHLTGGRHGESDQDQRKWPVGGWVQRQTRPFPLHPRSTVGASASGWRELRKRVCAPWRRLHPFCIVTIVPPWKENGLYKHTASRLLKQTAQHLGPYQCQVFGWSRIMSSENSQGQTDMGSCYLVQLPAQLQP